MEEESHSDCTVSLLVKSLWPPGECDHENPIGFVSALSRGLPHCCFQPSLKVALGPETLVAPVFSCSILCWVVQYSVFRLFVTILGSHSSGHLTVEACFWARRWNVAVFHLCWTGFLGAFLDWTNQPGSTSCTFSHHLLTCFTQGLSQEALNLIWPEISLAVCELGWIPV